MKYILTWFVYFQRWENRGSEIKSLGHTYTKRQGWESNPASKLQTMLLSLYDIVSCMEPALWICLITAVSLHSCILLCGHREKVASATLRWSSGIQFPSPTGYLLYNIPRQGSRRHSRDPEEQLQIQCIKIFVTYRDCKTTTATFLTLSKTWGEYRWDTEHQHSREVQF